VSGEPRVDHVITGLGTGGGAENLLLRLLERLDAGREGHEVLCLRTEVPSLAKPIEALGVPVHELGMHGLAGPSAVLRLMRALRHRRADVIQTWMLHSNVIGGLAGRLAVRSPLVWGVHLSKFDHSSLGTKAAVVQQAERVTSWGVPTRIVACSQSSEREMVKMGYRRKRIVTIPNGFDIALFRPDPKAREEVRGELGIAADTPVIGHVARFHPVKDHASLFAAAEQVLAQAPEVRFVFCGEGVDASDPAVAALAEPLGDSVVLTGQRDDVPRVLNAFDLAVSSSISEALSLAIGEAMATGLPVVATRAGESEELIGESGALVPIRDPDALAGEMLRFITMPVEARRELGAKARQRISDNYSLQAMVEGYRDLWAEVAAGRSQPPG
jgi:glycosyltransferase involved in cell wall biosynthesis